MKLSEILYEEFKDKGLPSLSEFVDYVNGASFIQWFGEKYYWESTAKYVDFSFLRIKLFNNFLKQVMELRRLVPCGKDGKTLEKPKKEDYGFIEKKGEWRSSDKFEYENKQYYLLEEEYQTALEDVIFGGFEVEIEDDSYTYFTNGFYWCHLSGTLWNNEVQILSFSDMCGQPITKNTFKFLD